MKSLLPIGLLLLAAIFLAGCNTPENRFMAGDTLVGSKPPGSAPAKPATPILVVAPEKNQPAKPEPVSVTTSTPPVIAVSRTPPSVLVPDDSTPAPTKPAEISDVPPATLPAIVTPDTSITGRVAAYNSAGRFVVLNFPSGPMPRQDQTIFLYRGGLKAGEVKITGPQSDNNTVGDVMNGDAQVGDEARDQ